MIDRTKHTNLWNAGDPFYKEGDGLSLFNDEHLFPCIVEYRSPSRIDDSESSFGFGLGSITGLGSLSRPDDSSAFSEGFVTELCNRHFDHLVFDIEALDEVSNNITREADLFLDIQAQRADLETLLTDEFMNRLLRRYASVESANTQFVASREVCSAGFGDAPDDLKLHRLYNGGLLTHTGKEGFDSASAGRTHVRQPISVPSHISDEAGLTVEMKQQPLIIYEGLRPVAVGTETVSCFLHGQLAVTDTSAILNAIESLPHVNPSRTDAPGKILKKANSNQEAAFQTFGHDATAL